MLNSSMYFETMKELREKDILHKFDSITIIDYTDIIRFFHSEKKSGEFKIALLELINDTDITQSINDNDGKLFEERFNKIMECEIFATKNPLHDKFTLFYFMGLLLIKNSDGDYENADHYIEDINEKLGRTIDVAGIKQWRLDIRESIFNTLVDGYAPPEGRIVEEFPTLNGDLLERFNKFSRNATSTTPFVSLLTKFWTMKVKLVPVEDEKVPEEAPVLEKTEDEKVPEEAPVLEKEDDSTPPNTAKKVLVEALTKILPPVVTELLPVFGFIIKSTIPGFSEEDITLEVIQKDIESLGEDKCYDIFKMFTDKNILPAVQEIIRANSINDFRATLVKGLDAFKLTVPTTEDQDKKLSDIEAFKDSIQTEPTLPIIHALLASPAIQVAVDSIITTLIDLSTVEIVVVKPIIDRAQINKNIADKELADATKRNEIPPVVPTQQEVSTNLINVIKDVQASKELLEKERKEKESNDKAKFKAATDKATAEKELADAEITLAKALTDKEKAEKIVQDKVDELDALRYPKEKDLTEKGLRAHLRIILDDTDTRNQVKNLVGYCSHVNLEAFTTYIDKYYMKESETQIGMKLIHKLALEYRIDVDRVFRLLEYVEYPMIEKRIGA